MPRPIEACIDRAALRHNYRRAKQCASREYPAAQTWAVVKANGYGHGLQRVAAALVDLADGFALLDLDEALCLREAGFRQPILLLEGFFEAADLPLCAQQRLTLTIHRPEQLRCLRQAAPTVRWPLYLKLNTGMNRLGLTAADLPQVRHELAALADAGRLGPLTLMTHFASADDPGGPAAIADQLECFERLRADWPEAASWPVSMANSAAILAHPRTAHDWVRAGIMLYGSSPFADRTVADVDLKPVMTLRSRILAVQTIAVGERVGYGGTFVASRPTRVGIVACGYADGYPRHAASGTPLVVAGQRTRTLGRVSMDMLAADLTDLPMAGVDSPVVLWGDGLPADEVAADAVTISYELFCALAKRVPVREI